MTEKEFSNEFDIYYNSIATNSAPGIDLYEKSVYLTRAQLEIVNNYFNPKGNKYNKGFEQSSKRRADLRELIRSHHTPIISTELAGEAISDDSQFFKIPKNVFLIIQEKALIKDFDECDKEDFWIKVVPKTHDEFNTQEDNPFKNPNIDEVWRIDYWSKPENPPQVNTKTVELISPYDLASYKFRYIIYPSPIILANLLDEYPSEDLTIDGITAAQTCALGEHIHREILNRAVEMATADYNARNLPVKVQMNQRNE